VESSCELGNEPLGSIIYRELQSGCITCGPSSGAQLHRVSYYLQPHRKKGTFNSVLVACIRYTKNEQSAPLLC
jgi:hypothetical protein